MPLRQLKSALHVGLLIHNINKDAERRTGLTLAQWSILKHLIERPAISAQKLSAAVRLHPSTLSLSLRRLVRRGFVWISADPRDSRRRTISLTREGKQQLDLADDEMNRFATELRQISAELTAVEARLLHLAARPTQPIEQEVGARNHEKGKNRRNDHAPDHSERHRDSALRARADR